MKNDGKFKKALFIPQNPNKIVGKKRIIYRSSYEYKLMLNLDTNPNVLEWASESMAIKYFNPITQKVTRYYPDFLVKFMDPVSKRIFFEMIEIKPFSQTIPPKLSPKKRKKTLLYETKNWLVNNAKWEAAKKFCESNNITFKIYTEKELGINR